MSAIRNPRANTSTGTPKSLEALSASLNRALAGARAPQVAAARRAHPRGADDPATTRTAQLAARRRTNLLIGTLDRLRTPAAARRGAT